MKILLLNANRAGVGTYHRALHFGRALSRRGHTVTMMTVSNQSRYRQHVRSENERFVIIECPNWLDELLPWHASGALDILSRIRELWRGAYDLVYAFEYQPNISLPVFLVRPFKPFRLMSDWCDWHAGASYHFGGYRLAHAVDRYFEELIRHHADFVTTINQTLYERARSIGIAGDDLAIVGEGVDPSYIAPLDKAEARRGLNLPGAAPIIGTIADSDWAIEVLCAAVAALRDTEARLLYIGTRPAALARCVQRHGIADRLLAPGRVSDSELPRYLGAADLFALPLEDSLANRGRWPHKLGDMLAARRPVVVSLGGEFPQLLRERDCAVVVGFGADDFAHAIRRILGAPAEYEGIAARGRQLIERELNWEVIGDQLEEALERATSA
jgi:glycosyltransferase involved in cell wall biosynthesis